MIYSDDEYTRDKIFQIGVVMNPHNHTPQDMHDAPYADAMLAIMKVTGMKGLYLEVFMPGYLTEGEWRKARPHQTGLTSNLLDKANYARGYRFRLRRES